MLRVAPGLFGSLLSTCAVLGVGSCSSSTTSGPDSRAVVTLECPRGTCADQGRVCNEEGPCGGTRCVCASGAWSCGYAEPDEPGCHDAGTDDAAVADAPDGEGNDASRD